ncbi:MAG: HNH endonuclease [Bdellovibrionales bacterium]|nr:HNH endonuclease [Bdellovibrionales bacterium]
MDFFVSAPAEHIKKQRNIARELRATQWWKQKLGAGICYYCEKRAPKDELTMDHVVPLARGGFSTKSNIVVCCKSCNTQKKYYTPAELELQKLSSRETE